MATEVATQIISQPSFTPAEPEKTYRNYENGDYQDRVARTYKMMHTEQCVDFVRRIQQKFLQFNHAELSLMEVCEKLDEFIDESDPDIGLPNSVHAYQTAERIRRDHPDKEWFIAAGFIHDFGKMLGFFGVPQYAVVGDTFPVGCAFSDDIVFGLDSFSENPDLHHPVYSTKYGMYKENCGLSQLTMSWGHDEYLYQVLVNGKHNLPQEALWIIRFHSFYPWHTSGAYDHLCDYNRGEESEDRQILKWVTEFNKYDLYTKSENDLPDVEKLKPYYAALLDKFVPGKLKW